MGRLQKQLTIFDMKENTTQGLLAAMFNPKEYSAERARNLLTNYGGTLCLLNDLKTCHRQGLSSSNTIDHEERIKLYGKNQQPLGQSLLKKSVSEQRDFMVNLLFYLLTLRVFIKLLLIRDEYRGLDPLGDYHPSDLRPFDELFSYILLLIMIFLKARVNIEYFNINQDERKYKNQCIKVKRDGEIQMLPEKELMVGDIMIAESSQTVHVDAIVLSCRNLIVTEAQTILKQDSKMKNDIWERSKSTDSFDAFVLAGSNVMSGEAELLVCTVGQNCTFRMDKDTKGNFSDLSPLMKQTEKTIGTIEQISKVLAMVFASWVSGSYLFEKGYYQHQQLLWLDFLYVLKVYSGFIGMICILQRLKILRSLRFFLEMNASGSFFRVKNRASLEKLSSLDILFIEASTIQQRKIQARERVIYEMDHIAQISELNTYIEVKIVSPLSKQKIKQIFDSDVLEEEFFVEQDDTTHRNKISSLMRASFLTNTTAQQFISNYLPVYQALKFEVGYLSNASNQQNQNFPKNLLHISFSTLEFYGAMKPKIQSQGKSKSDVWIKFQNKMVMEDILLELTKRSFVYAQLFNLYMSLFVNNVLVFIIFCFYSAFQQMVSLYWSLAIIIVNRYLFFTVYRRVAQSPKDPSRQKISIKQIMKLNVFLLPYYILVVSRLHDVTNFFIFFFVNSLFRIETHLFKIQPSKSIRPLLCYFLVFVALNAVNFILFSKDEKNYSQELENIQYTLGLLLIFLGYVLFM